LGLWQQFDDQLTEELKKFGIKPDASGIRYKRLPHCCLSLEISTLVHFLILYYTALNVYFHVNKEPNSLKSMTILQRYSIHFCD
jgi:hypothetical protein